jgi:hypothetical protein
MTDQAQVFSIEDRSDGIFKTEEPSSLSVPAVPAKSVENGFLVEESS